MNEKQWTESIRDYLISNNLGENIKVDILQKLPYAMEITQYSLDFKPNNEKMNIKPFETDMLIYEQSNDIIIPRIVIESKLNKVTTHDAITYSYKAQSHKNITPFLRYGIMIGNRKDYPLPGRLFRHGANFDFMISFKKEELSEKEKSSFIELLKKEITYSQNIQEMLLNSRSKDRKRYFLMQKKMFLKEIDN